MFERIHNDEERGQVGIGTLIVFIAMVLVAAIAAGVLINTAGFLQTQAEATGEESTSQVVDRMEVQSAVGEVAAINTDATPDALVDSDDPDANTDALIYQVDLTVTKAPGADNVDLDEATAELITDDGVNQVVLEEDLGDAGSDEPVEIDAITAESEDNIVLTDAGDRYTISFYGYSEGSDFADSIGDNADTDAAWIGDLEGGDSMEVRLTTAAGATTVEEVRVPDSLVDRDAVSL